MKISKILLQNFKSFKSESIDVPDIMAFIGENNAGKSNILKALELFFSETKTLEQHFFNDYRQKMVIQIGFRNLNEDAKKTFKKYLLDDNETVIIRKEYLFEGEEKEKQKLFAVILGENFEDEKDKKDAVEILDKEDINPFTSPDKHYFWKPNPFGWRNVAASYLPDFLYVPAVKDIKEEAKITEKSRFGLIINTMLASVLENEELKKVNETFTKLLMGENESQDGRIAQLKDFETTLSDKLSAHMKGTTLKLEVTPPDIKKVFQAGTQIIVDDGVPTPVETKGHGMQRSVIFVIFRAYAELLKKEQEKAKALIFGIEEPELYLHPQMQRAMFALLKEIGKTDQVIFTTHSSFFVDMSDYKSICIAIKKNLETGTKAIQYQDEIFQEDEKKKQFRLIAEFDPERNELFFGRKVILVEGDTEKVVLPLIAQKLKSEYVFYEHGFTIVECGSKDMIPFFARVLNKFRIPYVIIHDKDSETDPSNKIIADEVAASGGIGSIEILDPKFETVCANAGVSIPTGGSKPFNAFKIFKELDQTKIPNRLKEVIEKVFKE